MTASQQLVGRPALRRVRGAQHIEWPAGTYAHGAKGNAVDVFQFNHTVLESPHGRHRGQERRIRTAEKAAAEKAAAAPGGAAPPSEKAASGDGISLCDLHPLAFIDKNSQGDALDGAVEQIREGQEAQARELLASLKDPTTTTRDNKRAGDDAETPAIATRRDDDNPQLTAVREAIKSEIKELNEKTDKRLEEVNQRMEEMAQKMIAQLSHHLGQLPSTHRPAQSPSVVDPSTGPVIADKDKEPVPVEVSDEYAPGGACF